MRHTIIAVLIAVLVALVACTPSETEGTSSPRPHVAAGIDGESLSEEERRYLDDILEKAPDTKSGAEWRTRVVSATRADLDMILDGERLDFCEGASEDQNSFTDKWAEMKGSLRSPARRRHARTCADENLRSSGRFIPDPDVSSRQWSAPL
ncbi:hypothetical protein GCM10010271_73590 [Streptomyces kurssanovii]|nr:hypothetical protein GCM10010271_73590 [Streptomyces kurssanovii]